MVNSRWWNDDDAIMIDRSPGPGVIPYSFRIIPSVLLSAQIHRQINTPPPSFWLPSWGTGGQTRTENLEYPDWDSNPQPWNCQSNPYPSHWTIQAALTKSKFQEKGICFTTSCSLLYFVCHCIWACYTTILYQNTFCKDFLSRSYG